jgi:hypothetical protein
VGKRCGTPVDEAPVGRLAQIFANTLESIVVNDVGRSSMTGELGNSIADVEAASNVSVDKFA